MMVIMTFFSVDVFYYIYLISLYNLRFMSLDGVKIYFPSEKLCFCI